MRLTGGKVGSVIASVSAKALKNVIKADANSASCHLIYQPKAPEKLAQYRRK
ncbi:MAG: cyclic lactone autoinducer peptide [Agathobacter sp.]|nr:cyclic lactone autoinducer peptide [Agathobacter sp.]